MGIFSGVSASTLTAWLTESQSAYHALNSGQQVVSLAYGDKRLAFTPATADRLAQYIRELQTALAIANGSPDPRTRPSIATWTR